MLHARHTVRTRLLWGPHLKNVTAGRPRLRAPYSLVLTTAIAAFSAGCAFFPNQGPSSIDVVTSKPADPDKVQYALLDVSPAVLAKVQEAREPALSRTFGERRPPPAIRLGVGDVVSVTIFEAASGGLFIPQDAGSRAGNFVSLPNQEVDLRGFISVPYAGAVQAAGRTPAEVQAAIEERLRNRAIEPQAVVTLQDGRSSRVTVTGEVNSSVRFSITAGDRLLDAVARAGGPKYPAYETYVTLKRGNRTAKIYLNNVIASADNNVYLYPGDTVVLNREFRSFMALGASGLNGQINFENETLTLAQAVGRSGGILDLRGDPTQTFVYRLEPKALAAEMGIDVTPYMSPMVPVIYRVNMREPDGLFLATKFPMRDQDILFVSNSAASELAKFLAFLQLGANTVSDTNVGRIAIKGGRF
ncbi:polysaccharide biosynthesis/export family protein [Salinarimonas soli]|nr:polysaccharide biosynthesis/export family protein [Salinarimonas soli]